MTKQNAVEMECYNSGYGGQNHINLDLRIHATMNSQTIDEFIQRVIASLPADLGVMKQDMEKILKAAVQRSLARMDLVTREEYDVQVALLQRTREKLVELENKTIALEKQLQDEHTT